LGRPAEQRDRATTKLCADINKTISMANTTRDPFQQIDHTLFAVISQCLEETWGTDVAVSTCIKCGGHGFELSLFTPIGDSRKLTLVQCSNCGTPVGALEPGGGAQIEALRREVAAIDEKLNRIARALQDD